MESRTYQIKEVNIVSFLDVLEVLIRPRPGIRIKGATFSVS